MFWKRLQRIVLGLLAAYFLWKLLSWVACTPPLASNSLLVNRFWVERIARDERDLVHVLLLGNFDGQQGGIAAQRSQFRINADFLDWTLDREQLRIVFLQEDVSVSFRVRSWRCVGEV